MFCKVYIYLICGYLCMLILELCYQDRILGHYRPCSLKMVQCVIFFCLEYNGTKSLFRNKVGSKAKNWRYESLFSHLQSCGTLLELYGYHWWNSRHIHLHFSSCYISIIEHCSCLYKPSNGHFEQHPYYERIYLGQPKLSSGPWHKYLPIMWITFPWTPIINNYLIFWMEF